MQKTFFKFVTFELVERVARLKLLLDEAAGSVQAGSPVLYRRLQEEAEALQSRLFAEKSTLNRLFSEAGKNDASSPQPLVEALYPRVCELSRLLLLVKTAAVEPETYLFLKDALPTDWAKDRGEQTVLLVAEGNATATETALDGVLIDRLSVLQKNNPLAWVGLTGALSRQLAETASSVESLALDLRGQVEREAVIRLVSDGIALRLLGPAYYFQSVSEAVFARDETFFRHREPALFHGLHHLNFTHKSLVILHEACDRSGYRPEGESGLPEETLAAIYRVAEKLVPAKAAFQEKNLERAIALQERLADGTLLSSTPLYPVEDVNEKLTTLREEGQFSIYDVLGMMTEYPHTPREIVNAGWLHKIERGPVWLYATLNEENGDGYARLLERLDYQDHLLRKSIETSEVHRVLLCST